MFSHKMLETLIIQFPFLMWDGLWVSLFTREFDYFHICMFINKYLFRDLIFIWI